LATLKLESVTVRNFRGLKDLKIGGLRGLNVFVGPNNAGKSSILDVLRLLADACRGNPFGSRGGFKQVVFGQDQSRNVEVTLEISPSSSERRKFLESLFAHSTAINIETVQASNFLRKLNYSFSYSNNEWLSSESLKCSDFVDGDLLLVSRIAKNGQLQTKRVELEQVSVKLATGAMKQPELKQAEVTSPVNLLFAVPSPPPKEYELVKQIRQYILQWHWLGPTRRSSVSQAASEQFELSPDGDNLPSVLNTMNSNDPDLFVEIKNEVHMVIPDVVKMLAPLRGNSTTVLTKEDDSSVAFDPAGMSFGIQQTIMLVTRLLTQKAGSLLMIEEPENHLHARSQRKLLDVLRRHISRDEIQIFLTTHSCILTGCADDVRTYLVKKQGGVVSVHPIDEPSELRLVKAELGHKNVDLYGYECVVFVEGDTEELAIPIVSDSMGYDLVETGIRLINVRGKGKASKIEEYLRYLKDSDVTPFIIADSDKQVAQKVNEWIKVGLLPQDNCVIWPLEFEDCFGDERTVKAMKEIAQEHNFEFDLDAEELKKRRMDGKPVAKVLSGYLYEKGLPELDKPELGERLALIVKEEIDKGVKREETEPEKVIKKIVKLAEKS